MTAEECELLARNCAALWRVHPFREGNTRTICLFAAQYCMSINAPLAFQLFSSKPEFRNALLLATEGNDSTELGKMFKESRELQMALESKGLTTEVCVEKKKQEKRWRFRFWK
mgnify:CR=1 FL=1